MEKLARNDIYYYVYGDIVTSPELVECWFLLESKLPLVFLWVGGEEEFARKSDNFSSPD